MRAASLLEGVRLAIDQLRTNKFRSILTILGIVVGVATVMGMSAMITGIRSGVMESMDAAGPRNFIVSRFDFDEVRIVHDGSRPAWMDNPKITVEEARRIEELPAVRAAIVDVDLAVEMAVGQNRIENINVSANSVGWSEFTSGTLAAGHDFLPADVLASRPVVILSQPLAASLYGPLDPIGRQVRVNGKPFEVVGIFDFSGNVFADISKNIAIMPYTAALKGLGAQDDFLSILVVTADHATQAEAMDQVTGLLRSTRGLRPGEPNNFALIKQEELLKMFDRLTGVFFLVMIALSSVALMVGGVGVVAIMMIAVTERTREIGIRKALGATRREILWQFLVESATLTMIGAAIGMALGGSGAFLIAALSPIPAAVPLWSIAAALTMAGVAGVLFGLWPAWRAALLDPVDALRYE
jgi:putative ABC transport system permease protein